MSRGVRLSFFMRSPALSGLCTRSFALLNPGVAGRSVVLRDGGLIRGAYGVIACDHDEVFKNSSEGMVFVRVIERRMASSLVSGWSSRDIMSDNVVGGMGMDTWRP